MVMEEKKHGTMPHSLILSERGKLSVSGVEEVESFDETELLMHTVQGDLRVQGSDLHVDKLDLAVGDLTVSGHVSAMDYTEPRPGGGLFSRLFR